MAINSRTKGNRNERSVAHILKGWTGYDFSRVPSSGGLHWKSANSSGDIICTDKTHGARFPFSIECKFHEELDLLHLLQGLKGKKTNKIILFWEQALNDANEHDKVPLVFMRRNGMKADTHFVMLGVDMYLKWDPDVFEMGMVTFQAKGHELIILNSEDLIKTEYMAFYKAGRNIRKNGANK